MNHDHELAEWDLGLAHDKRRLSRRSLLALAGGAVAVLAACGGDTGGSAATAPTTGGTADTTGPSSTTGATTAATTAETSATAAACSTVVPEETAGPYPGDGSNGPDVLADPAVVRSDITTSFGDYTGTAEGVPATVRLTILDSGDGCAPLSGAVYLWHADRDGRYSMYTAPDANYLRGVQPTDSTGTATFTTVFPGCYDGRWPHIHFEVYPSVDDARAAANRIITSQIALAEDGCIAAYAADGYETSITNLGHTTLASDNVFRDGWDQELSTITGSIDEGFTIALTITV